MIQTAVRHDRTLAKRSFSLRSELRCTGARPLRVYRLVRTHDTHVSAVAARFPEASSVSF